MRYQQRGPHQERDQAGSNQQRQGRRVAGGGGPPLNCQTASGTRRLVA
ncbi:MAG TPA: hypothetical protein VFS21_39965 [Roseiflexaceae bacterium]|nr:hypothetical protein [Roseiflexaceae bacterium]